MKKSLVLYAIILIEGYLVLCTEILAIRQSLNFVGSGTDTVSIVIAAILLSLAAGYYAGSLFEPSAGKSVRKKLAQNFLLSAPFVLVGTSYFFLTMFFGELSSAGINDRVVLMGLYALVFLIVPTFLLGQTIPLISQYMRRQKVAPVAGKILLVSTLGSFLGSVFSTLVLMPFLGVHNTVIINAALFIILILLLGNRLIKRCIPLMGVFFLGVLLFNNGSFMRYIGMVSDNQYNTAFILEDLEGTRTLFLNRTHASRYNPNHDRRYQYIAFMEDMFLKPLNDRAAPKDILIIGVGGFVLGAQDTMNNYTYVDIDPALKSIGEEKIVQKPLEPNKQFITMDGRAFLATTDKTFDVILIDAFNSHTPVMEHMATKEFFNQIRSRLKPNGTFAGNYLLSVSYEDDVSRNLDSTIRSVMPYVSRQIIREDVIEGTLGNVIYSYTNRAYPAQGSVYTDNKNPVFYDR